MSGKPIDLEALLALVEQVMRICTQTTARSEGLESLLIDRGLVTKEALDAKIRERQELNQKIADALGSFGGEQDS
jgi:hypothetical protein